MAEQNLRTALTAEQLRAALIYDPETGVFTWRRRADVSKTWNTRYAGKQAGSPGGGGYIVIGFNYFIYGAHRLAWLWMNGEWPPNGEVDHIDTDGTNNIWTNLRDATHRQNGRNRGIGPNNTSGFKGVSRHGARWRAYIAVNYQRRHLGTFDTKEEAREAYITAAERLHGEFARIG